MKIGNYPFEATNYFSTQNPIMMGIETEVKNHLRIIIRKTFCLSSSRMSKMAIIIIINILQHPPPHLAHILNIHIVSTDWMDGWAAHAQESSIISAMDFQFTKRMSLWCSILLFLLVWWWLPKKTAAAMCIDLLYYVLLLLLPCQPTIHLHTQARGPNEKGG